MLAQQDIHVTIFEKVATLDPVGAGLLLQPSGLAVFEHLGLLDQAMQFGALVTGLEGQLPSGELIPSIAITGRQILPFMALGFIVQPYVMFSKYTQRPSKYHVAYAT